MFVVIFNGLSALTSCLFMKILSWTLNSGESLLAVQKVEKKKRMFESPTCKQRSPTGTRISLLLGNGIF